MYPLIIFNESALNNKGLIFMYSIGNIYTTSCSTYMSYRTFGGNISM